MLKRLRHSRIITLTEISECFAFDVDTRLTELGREDPLVEYEYEEIKAALVVERVISSNIGWRSLYKTKGNRRRMRIIIAIAFFSQWSGNGLLSYCQRLTPWKFGSMLTPSIDLAKVLGFVGSVFPFR